LISFRRNYEMNKKEEGRYKEEIRKGKRKEGRNLEH
jgi:hypothetical protein